MTRRRAGRPTPPRRWCPLVRVPSNPSVEAQALARKAALVDPADAEVWVNDRYVVHVDRDPDTGNVTHLSIRRQDRKPARDWRDFQRIKDQLAGPDTEAVELYPARDRVADSANQYHLWVLRPGVRLPIGFPVGLVLDHDEGPQVPGAVQRPIDPEDRAEGGILSEAPGAASLEVAERSDNAAQ